MTAIYFLILIVMACLVGWIATHSNMLRDYIANKAAFDAAAQAQHIKNPKAPYSLSRSQLAYWTVIIISSFLYVLIKNNFSPIPILDNNTLVLLGIAVGTTASAKIIDDSQSGNDNRSQDCPSRNFFVDILSDKTGISIHRLQHVLWTIIVGLIYVQYVASSGTMPSDAIITNQLLTLMGISTAAYIGIKATENSVGSGGSNQPGGGNQQPVPVNNPNPPAPANPQPIVVNNITPMNINPGPADASNPAGGNPPAGSSAPANPQPSPADPSLQPGGQPPTT